MIMRLFTAGLLLLLSSSVSITHGEFLAAPEVKWSYQIPGSGTLSGRGLRKGNAVVSSGDSVFCTADDGSLHVIKPNDLEASVVVEPPIVAGASAECRSGVAIQEKDGVFQFAVYAVTFIPTSDDTPITSRVIAVDGEGTEVWSVDVSGYIEGTPVVGVTGIYISHNELNDSGTFEGRVSVVVVANGHTAAVAAEIFPEDRFEAFGPLSSQTLKIGGQERDIVFWGETNNNGGDGFLYALMPSGTFNLFGVGEDAYSLVRLGVWRRTLITKPTVRRDLSGLFMGGGGSFVAGWVGASAPGDNLDTAFPVASQWGRILDNRSERDPRQPIPTSMIVSDDGRSIYVTNTAYDTFCLNAASGDVVWTSGGDGRSGYAAEPRLSEIEGETPVVYVIEELTGNIRQHDANSGVINWEFGCADRGSSNGCQDAVEADFHVAPGGNLLYFGDIYGRISAVEVATFVEPTSAPVAITDAPVVPLTTAPVATPVPTATIPGGVPGGAPTASPGDVPTAVPVTQRPTMADTTAPVPDKSLAPTVAKPTAASGPQPSPTISPVFGLFPDSALGATAPTGSGGNNSNQTLLIAMIVLFVAFALAAVGFFFLVVRKKRRNQADESEAIKKKRESEVIWQDQQKQLEEECRQQEEDMLREVGAEKTAPVPLTPKKLVSRNSGKKAAPVGTPSTLASIEEAANEDMSVASQASADGGQPGYDLASSISNLTNLTIFGSKNAPVEEKKDDEKSSAMAYLPKALASTFDNVVNLGYGGGGNAQVDTRANSPPPPPPPSTVGPGGHLSEKEAFNRYYVPGSDVAAAGAGPALYALNSFDNDDGSSIGSESMFLDDDSKSGRTPADDLSQPGLIRSKAKEADEVEEEAGAWGSLMSTLIQAEKDFFSPTSPVTSEKKTRAVKTPTDNISPLEDASVAEILDAKSSLLTVPDFDENSSNASSNPVSTAEGPVTKTVFKAAPFDEPDDEMPFDMTPPPPPAAMSPPSSASDESSYR